MIIGVTAAMGQFGRHVLARLQAIAADYEIVALARATSTEPARHGGPITRAALRAAGLPEPWVQMTVQPEALGLLFDDSHTLARLIGRPTTPLPSAVAEALRGRAATT
jgi:hypothetical protein